MANPASVEDEFGEWVELFNGETVAVDLHGWRIIDLDDDCFHIAQELFIQPGEYLVLGANGDVALNGGVAVAGVFASSDLKLANGDDELILVTADNVEADRLVWGGTTGLQIKSGASLERASLADGALWSLAQNVWPGSIGDKGSPGQPNQPQSPPTATETVTSTPVVSPELTETPTPTAASVQPGFILFTEVLVDPLAVSDNDGEWFEIYNAGFDVVNLRGWSIEDLGADHHTVATDLLLPPGGYAVLARNPNAATNGGVHADYSYSGLQLANGDDELILRSPNGTEADRIEWGQQRGWSPLVGASMERTSPTSASTWVASTRIWQGSSGDRGSPGQPYVAPEETPVATPSSPATPSPIATTQLSETPIVTLTPAPALVLSELMADPKAVEDDAGEWFEIYNADSQPVNLRGWQVVDLDGDGHTISSDLRVQPGEYVVLGRMADPTANGNVAISYVYSGISLANGGDELILLAPDGQEVDRVIWGTDAGLSVKPGISLERINLSIQAQWVLATAPWPGSWGDWGTPGQAPLPLTQPTVTPVLGDHWAPIDEPSLLLIEEVLYIGSDEEYVVLHNRGNTAISLQGWSLGDAEAPADGEGIYALPADKYVPAFGLYIVARNGVAFRERWGRDPDAEFEENDPAILTLQRRRDLASGTWALNDGGDEVVLLDPLSRVADVIAFGAGAYQTLGVSGALEAERGNSLQRVPGFLYPASLDLRHSFLVGPPRPFEARGIPLAVQHEPPNLGDGLSAVWGSLGALSNFSPGGTVPPHYLLASSSAEGLDFVALADRDQVHANLSSRQSRSPAMLIPAWRWQDSDGAKAIVYLDRIVDANHPDELVAKLGSQGGLVQWVSDENTRGSAVVTFAADDVSAPDRLGVLYDRWTDLGAPLLPAGNTNPPAPGVIAPAPRYTGLAVVNRDVASIRSALAARRGWLTSAPGLWLSMNVEEASGARGWMGGAISASNEIKVHVFYGDRSGEAAGLSLWQDNRLIRQLDWPSPDGHWEFVFPAIPGSYFHAVAMQADGDFAATAPIYVLPDNGGAVLLNEVLPAVWHDHNQDGKLDNDDEFIELYNPTDQPISLVGWQLSDESDDLSTGRRFTFGPGRFLAGRQWLRMWRSESGLNLNNENEQVRLIDPTGTEVDIIVGSSRRARDVRWGVCRMAVTGPAAWPQRPGGPTASSQSRASPIPSIIHQVMEALPLRRWANARGTNCARPRSIR
ncbi:MAG: lamin tail domain-containing protein [Caldilineaceae bacterium]|nr:lamin tail domain-containing protein [Caldilineaceae bacterium]